MKVFGLVGRSGAGKTTLMVKLLAELRSRGLSVSTVKHAHHGFDLDRPGKDSFRHREAGAKEVMLVADARWALMHEIGDEWQPPLEVLLQRMAPVDLVLTSPGDPSALPGRHSQFDVSGAPSTRVRCEQPLTRKEPDRWTSTRR